ncbi:hypothetical protein JCM8202_001892 [Rhodotorula sphaerocarpa]
MNYLVARLSDTLAGQSILSALRSLRAQNLNGVGKFLDDHEEILSRAREVGFSLVRDIAATATPAQRSEASNLHYVYSDFIFEGLPSSANWKAWAAVYCTSETSTFSPREILDRIHAEYYRLRANQTASTGGLLLANNHHGDNSMTAAITRTSGRDSGNQQGLSRRKCQFCKRDSPNHTPEKCWKNPKVPDNRLGNSGSSASGNSNQKSSLSSLNYEKVPDRVVPRMPVSTAAGPSLTGIGRGNVEIELETATMSLLFLRPSTFRIRPSISSPQPASRKPALRSPSMETATSPSARTVTSSSKARSAALVSRRSPSPTLFLSCSLPLPPSRQDDEGVVPIIERQATKPLQRLHSDLPGPFPFLSFGGAKYFVIVCDKASGWIDNEPLRDKTEVPEAFMKVFFRMRAEFKSSKVGISESTTLQTDNGTEYSSRTFATFLAEQGITRRLSIPYTPQQNGLSERSVRTVKEKITTCLIQARLPKAYRAEMFYYALFVIDKLPYSPNGGETPYHFLHHRRNPFFSGAVVPVVGQEVWVHDPDAGVFDEKARRAIFLGIGVFRGTKGFRVQDVNDKGSARMFWSRNVQSSPGDLIRRSDFDDEDDFSWVEEEATLNLPLARRSSSRTSQDAERGSASKPTGRAGAVIVAVNIANEPQDSRDAAILAAPVAAASKEAFSHAGRPTSQQPASTKDALSSIYLTDWRKGMEKSGTASLSRTSSATSKAHMKILGIRWHHTARVFPEEEKAQLKSRLVVQGIKTIPFLSSFGPTFTLLSRWDVVAIFFVLATRLKLPVVITDFAKAYLGAKVATGGEPVFVKQPPGYEVPGREDKVYELRRAAYGGFRNDVTLYVGCRAGDYVLFILYVNDGLIAGKKDLVEDVVGELQGEFDVTFKGSVHGRIFLGRDIEYDHNRGLVVVKVTSQIRKALKMHGFEDVKPVHMPIQPGIVYKTNTGAPVRTRDFLCRRIASFHRDNSTRPPLRRRRRESFLDESRAEALGSIKRIFAYLKATAEVGLSLSTGQSSGGGLTAYVDADHAGDVESRRSTTGVVIQLDGSAIHTISRSRVVLVHHLFPSLPIGNNAPLRILNDNLSSVKALLSPAYTEEKEQHDVKIKFVREQIEREFVELKWIPGADNVADLLTKALPARQVRELGSRIGLVNWPSEGTWGAR